MRAIELRAVIVAFFLCISAATGGAATYYVDASNGNDANDGLSSTGAWRTLSKVNGSPLQPGDNVLLKRGQLWREALVPPSSGTSTGYITFGAYSSGAKPVISGADVVNGLPYMVNDTFTGNAVKGWVGGHGTVTASNEHLVAVLDGTTNTSGDYLTKDTLPLKDAWLMFRLNLPHGYNWSNGQYVIGSGLIDGAFVGLINSGGTPMWRIRVERNGGYDYYLPSVAPVAEGVWNDIRIHVKAASAAGALDGAVQVWINGVQALNLTAVNNDTKTLKKICMGNAFYAPNGMTMQYWLDEVKLSNRAIDGTESTAWTPTGSTGSDGAAIYSGYAFYDSSTLFENRGALKKVPWNTNLATTAAAMQQGTWTLDTSRWILYVIPSTPVLPDINTYEAADRLNCILVNGINYTRYQGLELKNSDREALLFMKLTGIEISDILAHHNGCQGTNLSVVQGQTVSDAYVHDSVFRDSSWNGVSTDSYYGPSSNVRIINNTVYNNIHNGIDFKASGNYTYSNLTVSGNRSYNNGTHGLYMQNYPQGGASNATISRNLFYRNYGAGMYVHKYFSGQDHSGIKVYGNTFAYNGAVGGFGPGLTLDAVDSEVRGNNFYTDSVSASGNSEYRINGSGDSADYNNSFDRTRPAYLYFNGAAYTFPTFQGLGFDLNGTSSNPKFTSEFTDEYTLAWDSPAIDAGTSIPGITTDILGNPIYGTPDLGAFEYQPPYSMGTDRPDAGGNIRIYADGKYRNTASPSGTGAELYLAPGNGFTSGNYAEWMNVVVNAWTASASTEQSWREASALSGPTSVSHVVGNLQPNTYYDVVVDSVTGTGISGTACNAGVCLSDAGGRVSFSYSGDYSPGSHSFSVRESGAAPSCVALSNATCYPSIASAYQALPGDGTILVRNVTLTENLTFDRNLKVTILGGYDAGFVSRTGLTTVSGTLTVNDGSATLAKVVVK